jgi:hypothetical protein
MPPHVNHRSAGHAVKDGPYSKPIDRDAVIAEMTEDRDAPDDAVALASPWGFDPQQISVPIYVWHGKEDVLVPVGHGRWLAERIPNRTFVEAPGEAHLAAFAMQDMVVAGSPQTDRPPRTSPNKSRRQTNVIRNACAANGRPTSRSWALASD